MFDLIGLSGRGRCNRSFDVGTWLRDDGRNVLLLVLWFAVDFVSNIAVARRSIENPLDESNDFLFWLGANEAVDDLFVLHCVDRWNALDLKSSRYLRIRFDVDLG